MFKNIAFIRRGSLRFRVFKLLTKRLTPTQLAVKLKTHRSTICNVIAVLMQKDLVKNRTEKGKGYTIYSLTPKGLKLLKEMKNFGLFD